MSKFTDYFKQLQEPVYTPPLPLYGLGELVCYGGFRWIVTGFKPDEKEGCWVYDLERVDGSEKTEEGIHEMGLMKSYLLEKDASLAPWDKFLNYVKNTGTVMTFDEKVKSYMQKLGIAGAGPIPNSLLAAQDLEGTRKREDLYLWEQGAEHGGQELEVTEKSGTDMNSFSVWYYDPMGARKCAVFGSAIDAEAYARVLKEFDFKDISILKGQVEQTGKQLEQAAEKAGDLAEHIKQIQIKRQKATLIARQKETNKSFKQTWDELAQSSK